MAKKPKLDEDVEREVADQAKSAISFIVDNLEPDWATAEKYYLGKTDLPSYEGRSNVVKTEVRDAIRNIIPSIMRIMLQSRKIVEYIPVNPLVAAWADQQSEYVTQLFWASDGFRQLHAICENAAKLKYAPVQVVWEPRPAPKYFSYTGVALPFIEELMSAQNIGITSLEEHEPAHERADYSPNEVELYDISGYEYYENGRIELEAVAPYEFFIDENSDTIQQAVDRGIHGTQRLMSVSEAEELGLECDDWSKLGSSDPETNNFSASSMYRRELQKGSRPDETKEENKQVLITCAYKSYDLDDNGFKQLYRFWFGGTGYELLHFEPVEESPFEIARLTLKAHTPFSQSIADIMVSEQDTSTSLLRAFVDNAHAANNPRPVADPRLTNFDDLTSTALNAPVRSKKDIQYIATPFTGQGVLQALQYMDQDNQTKVGVTKAALGLDPDAMQSTDKNAVLNTIQTSQGQTELMVSTLLYTAIIPIFRKMLTMATRHFSPIQVIKTKGKVIPVNLKTFDASLVARPNVGLGTASTAQKRAALSYVFQLQEKYMQEMGPGNPFTSYVQMYNTLEDMLEIDGLHDVGRYFNAITPQVEQKLAEYRAAQAKEAAKNQPADPSKALFAIEAQKARVKYMEVVSGKEIKERELALKALQSAEEIDLKRDELSQSREIELAKINASALSNKIKKEQDASKPASTDSTTGSSTAASKGQNNSPSS